METCAAGDHSLQRQKNNCMLFYAMCGKKQTWCSKCCTRKPGWNLQSVLVEADLGRMLTEASH